MSAPRTLSIAARARQHGASLMLAIFLIVSLGAISAYVLTASVTQQESVAQDTLGAQAYHLARAGADWGAFQVLRNSGGAFAGACAGAGAGGTASASLTFPAVLPDYTVVVGCTAWAEETEGSVTNRQAFRILATACNRAACPAAGAPGPTYVERQVHLSLTR